jgi:hypothetical protein
MAKAELQPDRVIKRPFLGMSPPLGFVDSGLAYTGTDIEVGDLCSEKDEDVDEGDEDYDPFEFDVDSDFGSDYISVRSESSTPTSYYVAGAFDWPSPYRGKIVDGEGYPHTSTFTLLESPLQGSSSLPSFGSHPTPFDPFDLGTAQPPNTIPWSAFTDPFTGTPVTAPPLQSPVALVSAYNAADDTLTEAGADWFLAEMEEGLWFASGPTSESTLDSFEGDAEGWYDRFDLTGYTFPAPPQQPQSLRVAAGFEAPPPYATAISSPDTEESEDAELDAVVVSPRSPVFWWR